ncbi:hypothetical protein BC830DRAFT_813824 [Chytriomyces sp. MP71]|nr:hypothetical protein BC830DRAFT_813824 [Chytriomyces sp. MP71]
MDSNDTPQWHRYSELSGDKRPLRFLPSSQLSQGREPIEPEDDEAESSASLYRQLLATPIPTPADANPSVAKRLPRDLKSSVQSASVSSAAVVDSATTRCAVCQSRVPTHLLSTHETSTAHLHARLEAERDDSPQPPPTLYAFNETHVGYRMLQQQGWRHGETLGTQEKVEAGMVATGSWKLRTPVAPRIKRDVAGLGVRVERGKGVMLRVGDTFKKSVAEQVDALDGMRRRRGREEKHERRTRREIAREAKETRKKGIAVLKYLNAD